MWIVFLNCLYHHFLDWLQNGDLGKAKKRDLGSEVAVAKGSEVEIDDDRACRNFLQW